MTEITVANDAQATAALAQLALEGGGTIFCAQGYVWKTSIKFPVGAKNITIIGYNKSSVIHKP